MRLKVRISPNSKKNEIIGWFGDQLKIKITAPAEKGKANKELINFLARELELARSSISIIKGLTSRSKTLNISRISAKEFSQKITSPQIQDKLI